MRYRREGVGLVQFKFGGAGGETAAKGDLSENLCTKGKQASEGKEKKVVKKRKVNPTEKRGLVG